jgi:hypothetical protein
MRVWMCEYDECRVLWIRGVLVRRHPIAVEALAKLQTCNRPLRALLSKLASPVRQQPMLSCRNMSAVQLQIATENRVLIAGQQEV